MDDTRGAEGPDRTDILRSSGACVDHHRYLGFKVGCGCRYCPGASEVMGLGGRFDYPHLTRWLAGYGDLRLEYRREPRNRHAGY